MAAPRRTGRSRFTLFVLALASVTLLTLDARGFGPVQKLEDGIGTVFSPVRSAASWVASPVEGGWDRLTGRDELEDRVRELEAQLGEAEGDQIADAAASEELDRLQAQLGVEGISGIDTSVAAVTAGSISNFDGDVIEINKGSEAGYLEGMPVLGAGGLIGRLEDVHAGRSLVRLIVDPEFAVGIAVVDADQDGLARGDGRGRPLRVLQGVELDAEIDIGAAVITSGSQGSLFPRGIAVGTVVAVDINEGALTLELDVDPSGVINNISVVTILLYDPDNPPAALAPDQPTEDTQATDVDDPEAPDPNDDGGSPG